ncbi:unannotated protein [freshwater metagenome]|uniref:Unannotated protein n=1 Tax=freshwater metagenome TaxID=449393 RepID=A0A6J6GSN8_9ZZZZ
MFLSSSSRTTRSIVRFAIRAANVRSKIRRWLMGLARVASLKRSDTTKSQFRLAILFCLIANVASSAIAARALPKTLLVIRSFTSFIAATTPKSTPSPMNHLRRTSAATPCRFARWVRSRPRPIASRPVLGILRPPNPHAKPVRLAVVSRSIPHAIRSNVLPVSISIRSTGAGSATRVVSQAKLLLQTLDSPNRSCATVPTLSPPSGPMH